MMMKKRKKIREIDQMHEASWGGQEVPIFALFAGEFQGALLISANMLTLQGKKVNKR
jgi:hypothetical protein